MAIPAFAAALGKFAGRFAVGQGVSVLSAGLDPATYWAKQKAWKAVTTWIPSMDSLFDMISRGYISYPLANHFLEMHGVDFWVDAKSARNNHQQVWAAYLESLYQLPDVSTIMNGVFRGTIDKKDAEFFLDKVPAQLSVWETLEKTFMEYPSPDQVIDMELRGFVEGDELAKLRKYAGIDNKVWNVVSSSGVHSPQTMNAIAAFLRGKITRENLDAIYKDNRANTVWHKLIEQSVTVPPDPGLIMSLWKRGMIDDDTFRQAFKDSLGADESWRNIGDALGNTPTIGQMVAVRNRGLINDDTFDTMLKQAGLLFNSHRDIVKQLREEYPPVSDLITFAVKEVFDAPVANRLRLYDEVPENLRKYFNAQGLHVPLDFNITVNGADKPASWLDMYWGAHWYPISPTQAYMMLHRLRPDRIPRYKQQGFDVEAFTIDDVRRWLKIADYSPGVRDYLAAISYNPMRLIDIRNAFMTEVKDANWAKDQLMDRGLHPDDADTTIALMIAQKQDKETSVGRAVKRKYQSRYVEAIVNGFKIGTFNRAKASDTLQEAGFSEDDAEFMLDSAQLEVYNSTATKTMTALRRNYLNGGISEEELIRALDALDIAPEYRADYIKLWNIERSVIRKVATTERIIKWFTDGLITEDQAMRRLRNLGWEDADALLYVADAKRGVLLSQAKQLAALQRSRVSAAKDLAAQQKELAAQKAKVEARIRQLTPLSQMKKWFEKGIINERLFRLRLRAMGYTPTVVNFHVTEVQQKVSDAKTKKQS